MRKLLTILSIITLTMTGFQPIMAKESAASEPLYEIVDENNVYEFYDKQSYDNFKNSMNENNAVARIAGYDYVYTTLWTSRVSKQWIGYHSATPSWSKASQYVLTTSQSYSASVSYTYKGYNFTFRASYSVSASTTFPADASRYSKLGVRADVTYQRIQCDVYYYGVKQSTYYNNVAIPTSYYISVVYQ